MNNLNVPYGDRLVGFGKYRNLLIRDLLRLDLKYVKWLVKQTILIEKDIEEINASPTRTADDDQRLLTYNRRINITYALRQAFAALPIDSL